MRKIVVFLLVSISFFVYSDNYKYGIVKDTRGYSEVRETAAVGGKITAKIKNNTLVHIEKTEGSWVKISAKTEYYDKGKYSETVEGYIPSDKLSYEFGPVVYVDTDAACDNVTIKKLVLKNKINYENFNILAYYLEKQTNEYREHGYNYTVKTDPAEEYSSILKISNGLEMKITEDYEFFISELKYKKININSEKEPDLGQFVPDTSISGVNRTEILENKNYTYIKIPVAVEKERDSGCSIEDEEKVFIFKDNKLASLFDIVYENITKTREFDKWIKVKE